MTKWAIAIAIALLASGCEREARRFDVPAKNQTPAETAPRMSSNQPAIAQQGNVRAPLRSESPYDENAYAVNQGKRLYRWYNCNGCHSMGGGGIGPALMDSQWKYGGDPASIFDSIMRGRPEGMPSFGGHIPEDQVWQIVAYVRSMGGQLRKDVAPSRADTLYPGNPENARPKEAQVPQKAETPVPGARP
ncbi:c-type cytochrome [Ramlibacter sp. PS4R-6]|uniref:c-type cytochrome n=1 Tax=Ramlibacter sp. PS4R-6 TaxID=3133438 RepID=UPI0030B241DA